VVRLGERFLPRRRVAVFVLVLRLVVRLRVVVVVVVIIVVVVVVIILVVVLLLLHRPLEHLAVLEHELVRRLVGQHCGRRASARARAARARGRTSLDEGRRPLVLLGRDRREQLRAGARVSLFSARAPPSRRASLVSSSGAEAGVERVSRSSMGMARRARGQPAADTNDGSITELQVTEVNK
jgi:hypothetical protein